MHRTRQCRRSNDLYTVLTVKCTKLLILKLEKCEFLKSIIKVNAKNKTQSGYYDANYNN
jgi:hypothetical protein